MRQTKRRESSSLIYCVIIHFSLMSHNAKGRTWRSTQKEAESHDPGLILLPNQKIYPDCCKSQDFKTVFSLESQNDLHSYNFLNMCVVPCEIQCGLPVPNNVSLQEEYTDHGVRACVRVCERGLSLFTLAEQFIFYINTGGRSIPIPYISKNSNTSMWKNSAARPELTPVCIIISKICFKCLQETTEKKQLKAVNNDLSPSVLK